MSVTLSGITYDLDQAGWGSALEYDDRTLDGLWDPSKVVVHWGGLTIPPRTTRGINRLFRGWQRFHLGKGWQDIAYGAGSATMGSPAGSVAGTTRARPADITQRRGLACGVEDRAVRSPRRLMARWRGSSRMRST